MAKTDTKDAFEVLGYVSFPSGICVGIDAGMLDAWCHDRPPVYPEGKLPDEIVQAMNSARTFEIVGPDAALLGAKFDRCTHPRYIYDVLQKHEAALHLDFAALLGGLSDQAGGGGLVAQLEARPTQMTHRDRISACFRDGDWTEGITFFGVPVAVVEGLPTDRKLRVLGRRSTSPGRTGCWSEVWLEVVEGGEVEWSEARGRIGVDWARVLFADADALGGWEHEEPIDGLADFALWGRDAAAAAQEFGAAPLGDGQFGWEDQPWKELLRTAVKVEETRQSGRFHFTSDFRPHSHHWAAMKQVRASETESGSVAVAGAEMCLFMTTWGDGVFDVMADFDEEGRLVSVTLKLETEAALARLHAVNLQG